MRTVRIEGTASPSRALYECESSETSEGHARVFPSININEQLICPLFGTFGIEKFLMRISHSHAATTVVGARVVRRAHVAMSGDQNQGFGFASRGTDGDGEEAGPSRADSETPPGGAYPTSGRGAVAAVPKASRDHARVGSHDPNCVLVSRSQDGNPVLRHIRNVRWKFADVIPDFVLGVNSCAVFISLRYHLLHPQYLPTRILELQRKFRLCVVLCLVDAEDVVKPMGEVNKIAAMGDCTLLCAWSSEEAARYVETLKAYEHKSPEAIREKTDADYVSRLTGALTSVRGVNKVDAATLGANFGSLAALMRASAAEMAASPGIGPAKVKRLRDALHVPFRRRRSIPVEALDASPG